MTDNDISKFFRDTEKDSYFRKLYQKMTDIYCSRTVNVQSQDGFNEKEMKDLLLFADILACSSDPGRKNIHQGFAHIVAVEMMTIYPGNPIVRTYSSDIFDKTGNHKGIEEKDMALFEVDKVMFNEYLEKMLSIPGKKGERFFVPQKKIYDSLNSNLFSYSAPTSMGKSMMIRIFIKQQILNGSALNYALVIPSKALINELKSAIINDLRDVLSEKGYRVVNNIGDAALESKDAKYVFVVTPERLLYILINRPEIKIDYLFVDESHKISCFNTRGPYYYKVIEILKSRNEGTRFIFAAPNIPNPDEYLKLVQNHWTRKNYYRTAYSPVSQIKMIIDLKSDELRSFNDLTSTFSPAVSFDFEGDNDEKFNEWLKRIIWTEDYRPRKTLVYVYKKPDAFKFARQIAAMLPVSDDQRLKDLATEIRRQIHRSYELADFIEKGVAAHVGYLPPSIRSQIEDLFKDENSGLFVLCCTSTLIEGVNLPAENLVITSTKTGQNDLSEIEFRNLIGRIGRVNSRLYGNVFMMQGLQDDDEIRYEDLLQKDIPEQKLSVVENLTEGEKKKVIETLKKGELEFGSSPEDANDSDRASAMRKFGLTLLSDIMKGRKGIVYEEFSKYMEFGDEKIIKDKFTEKQMPIDDDITVSADQTQELEKAIRTGRLAYPYNITYRTILYLLTELSTIFKWEKYEPDDELGSEKKLKFYAVLLNQWMNGVGLPMIIQDSIKYKIKTKGKVYYNKWTSVLFNPDLPEHINLVIENTLENIDSIVLFSLSNYFLKVSTKIKELKGVKSFKNDWSEYLEYGTNKDDSIWLQKLGFSRESTYYITKLPDYKKGGKLSRYLCNCRSASVSKEARDVFINYPEMFN